MNEYQRLEAPFDTPLVSEVTALARGLFGGFDVLDVARRLASTASARP